MIYDTEVSDFTYNTYNFCWPIRVAILACCGPLLWPVFQKYTSFSFEDIKKMSSSRNDAARSNPAGFNQLSEAEIHLQSVTLPASVASITGSIAGHKRETRVDEEWSGEQDKPPVSSKKYGPDQSTQVERSWDFGSNDR